MPTRIDTAGELLRVHETPAGALLFEGRSAKPGVYPYRNADGSMRRELIDVDELHDPASLATAGRATLTLEHPPENVRADNWKQYSIGDIDGEIVCEPAEAGGFVRVRGAIRDAAAIQAFKKDTQELSWMYDVDLDETPGEHPAFGPYDAIQRNRRYNSLALTTRGRHGSAVRARADSAVMDLPETPAATPEIRPMHPRLIALLVASGLAAPEAEAQLTRADGHAMKMLGDAIASLEEGIARYQGEADAMKKKCDEMKAELETMRAAPAPKADAAELLAYANERHPLLVLAAAHKVDSAETLTNDALREAIVKQADPSAKLPAGLHADHAPIYWRARCDSLPAPATAASTRTVQGTFPKDLPAEPKRDSSRKDDDDGLDAWTRSIQKNLNTNAAE